MLVWNKDPSYRLVELSDLDADPPPTEIADDLEPLRTIARWSREYLSRPHPDLGREGPVCPYAEGSRRKGTFFMAVRRGNHLDVEEIQTTLLAHRDWFLELEPREGSDSYFKTILILFPDLDQNEVTELIDGVQERLKPDYVQEGLMLGEFHSGPPDKAGLWNPDFRPLASPVPMLVIRNMVATDFGFLKHDPELASCYLKRFGEYIPAHIRGEVQATIERFGLAGFEGSLTAAVHPRVREVLEQHGVDVRVHRHQDLPLEIRGPQDVAAALGWPLERITKSLFVRCRCHGRYAVVVCPVNRKVDLTAAARELGCTRLELASRQELAAFLEYPPGGVSPIAVGNLPVLLDRAVLEHPTVLVAAGEVRVEVEIDPARLRTITGARVLSLTGDTLPAGVGKPTGVVSEAAS